MNQLPSPPPVRLVLGLRSVEPALIDELTGRLALEFGQVLYRSDRWLKEASDSAGGNVQKQWIALADTIDPAALIKIKLHTLRVEQLYLTPPGGDRRVRLDALYVDSARVVRAVEADAPHRLYLGSGLYGEILFHWGAKNGFEALPWTQPEDAALRTREFFNLIRQDLLQRRKQGQADLAPDKAWKG